MTDTSNIEKAYTLASQRYAALGVETERAVETSIDRRLFDVPVALMCSEPTPECCHRRLAAEYLAERDARGIDG